MIPQDGNLKSSRMVVERSFFPPLSARNCHGPGAKRASLGGSGASLCSVKVRPKLATTVHEKRKSDLGIPTETGSGLPVSSPMVHLFQDNQRSSPTEYRTGPVLFHGRLSDRMGSQLERLPHLGILDYWAPGVPYKLVRDGSSQTGGSPLGFPDSQWQGQTLRLYFDNSMTIAYIQKKGAPDPGLFTKTVELLNLFDLQHINLTQTHFPGSRNVTADALSRMNSPSPTEWRLPQETLNSLFCVLENPLVDMFASQ